MKKIVESYLEFLQAASIVQNGRMVTTYDANPKKRNAKTSLARLAKTYSNRRLQNHH